MDELSPLTLAFRWFLFFLGAFGLPQGTGVLALWWAWRKPGKIMLIPALLIAPAIFFATAYTFWGMRAASIRAEGHYVCGAFGAAAFFSTTWGTILHLGLSGAVLFVVWLTAAHQPRPLWEET